MQIETANGDEFVELDREARAAVSRLKELSNDAANWNKCATVRDNAIVQALLKGAVEFRKNNALLLALAYMNRERADLAALSERNPEEARALLAANITKNQEVVLISIAASVPNAIHLTRAEAYKLIDSNPTLRRPPETGDGWFEWTNLQGERYRLCQA
ncbi:hypothetical protein ACN4EK_31700 [Pantanalinema rosaneae CENA516]|uniref:hypothetical protein n=1 Tax=Pantanalinema rosaneae TaxID=1620701 RepID=UPI003D6FB1FC